LTNETLKRAFVVYNEVNQCPAKIDDVAEDPQHGQLAAGTLSNLSK